MNCYFATIAAHFDFELPHILATFAPSNETKAHTTPGQGPRFWVQLLLYIPLDMRP